ncbi:hypothetical protein [Burkholderia gladioli]|uniref:hypothetical protein n=1 Tax=Burkholderia gladioli TaxID=28095 RepID=UPI001640DC71|nr:hypothetical protein [Burkholderia gladioli]MDN7813801.1 hypothetical protein [Burkholderia gladioli]
MMNMTRLRQSGLVVAWTVETVCVGVAAPWILIPGVLASVMLMNDTVMSQHLMDQLIWHVVGTALWTRLTWLSMVLVLAYRLAQTRPAQDAVDRAAIRVGRLVQRRAPQSFTRLELEPGTLGRMVFVLFANFTILIVGLLWLSVYNGAPRLEASASTTPILACPYTVSPLRADTATFDHDTTFTNKEEAA